jgi:hypothetical protein
LKLDSIHSGFAAGCEARLCLAARVPENWGWAPGSASGLQTWGKARTEGAAPFCIPRCTARRSLASHPAAKPESIESSFRIVSDLHRAAKPESIQSSFRIVSDLHRAAKPESIESSFRIVSDLHRAAKPESIESSFRSHQAAKPESIQSSFRIVSDLTSGGEAGVDRVKIQRLAVSF